LLLTPGGLLAQFGPVPNADPLRTSAYEVRVIPASEARPLVEQWHYARGMGYATACASLHVRACGTPVAVAVFNPPSLGAAKLMAQGGHRHQDVIGLSRLCFDPAAPKNAGSFLLARAVAALPERWSVISTYADEGQGVVGVTYQATNFTYLGRSEPRAVWTRDGVQVSVQRGGKTLTHEQMHQEGCVLAGRAAMHRYRMVRGQPAPQRPQD
jgi:hypothetical protein